MSLVLVDIGGGHRLAPGPAASYARMRAEGCPPGITSSYRSRTHQAALRAAYLAGLGAFALPPGQSQHEVGYALDVPAPARTWFAAWSAPHGWRRTNPAEVWHYEWFLPLDRYLLPNTPPPPAIVALGGTAMKLVLVRHRDRPEVWLSNLLQRRWVRNETELTDITFWLRHTGQDMARCLGADNKPHVVGLLDTFGTPIGPTPK